jgi:O-antigen ligase
MFFSLLLIGGDLIALHAGPLTLRVVFPLMMVCFAFLFQRIGGHIVFDRPLAFLFFLLSVAAAASIQSSLDPVKSIGYTVWVLFDFFIIIGLVYNFAKLYPPELTLGMWFLVYRIHVVLLYLELMRNIVFRHSLERPHIWFYESSYLAIFMAGYFGSALFMFLRCGKPYRRDFIISILGMLATTSATGFFAMIFAVALNFLVARQRTKLLLVTALCLGGFLGILYLFFQNTIYYQLVGGFLLSGHGVSDIYNLVLERSGNRWIRAVVGWNAFLHHPWLGVGIGGDSAYMGASPFPAGVAGYLRPWMELDRGQPFCNVFVEVLGTMGIVGFVPFVGILLYAAWQTIKTLRDRHHFALAAIAFFMGFFSTLLALQFDGTMLRYYLWSPLGLALGVMGQMRSAPAEKLGSRPLQPEPALT